MSRTVRLYEELTGVGLPACDPIQYIREQQWAHEKAANVWFPLSHGQDVHSAPPQEMYYIGAVTRLLRPQTIFEIGTFNGKTTCVLIMNAPAEATIYSLDLPDEDGAELPQGYMHSDARLVRRRKVGSLIHDLGLELRYTQVLGNSLHLDSAPYTDAIDLAFIDGAHTYKYVRSDTEKIARMVRNRAIVFWHDYGGRGDFADLSSYLERLRTDGVEVYRIAGTTLAWSTGEALRKVLLAAG